MAGISSEWSIFIVNGGTASGIEFLVTDGPSASTAPWEDLWGCPVERNQAHDGLRPPSDHDLLAPQDTLAQF
jgi:hypothetical protein